MFRNFLENIYSKQEEPNGATSSGKRLAVKILSDKKRYDSQQELRDSQNKVNDPRGGVYDSPDAVCETDFEGLEFKRSSYEPSNIPWTQAENTFALIEESIGNLETDKEWRRHEERIEFLYRLLGTIIVEKSTDHYKRKVDINYKLSELKFRLEKRKKDNVANKLEDVSAILEEVQRSNAPINKENAEKIKSIRKTLVILSPKESSSSSTSFVTEQNHLTSNHQNLSYTKQVEGNVLHKLKTFQSFWSTIKNSLRPSISKEVKDGACHVLRTLSVEINAKLKELDGAELNGNDQTEENKENEEERDGDDFKEIQKIHTFETLQIARRALNLRNKVKVLIEDVEGADVSRYDKLKRNLEKCQDAFEDIESHSNPDVVALRTETFELLLKASRLLNDKYEEKLTKS